MIRAVLRLPNSRFSENQWRGLGQGVSLVLRDRAILMLAYGLRSGDVMRLDDLNQKRETLRVHCWRLCCRDVSGLLLFNASPPFRNITGSVNRGPFRNDALRIAIVQTPGNQSFFLPDL